MERVLNCANCEYSRAAPGDGFARAAADGGFAHNDHVCHRMPAPIRVSGGHVCGEHSEWIAKRALELADLIAVQLVRQARVPTEQPTPIGDVLARMA